MKNLIKVNVINKDGKLVVSSREIAENFGRRHDNVKRDLELILQSHSSNLRGEIVESTYVNRGKECKEYLLTEKGFTLYMFNIQGYNEFKLAYIEEFDRMKEYIKTQKPQLSPQEQLALQLFNGGIDAITAHKQLLALETKELNERIIEQQETIEEKETEIKQLSPLAEILIKRFEKGDNIGWTDITKTFGLKRGQASKWAVSNGYIYKSKKDVTSKGDKYFQRYLYNGHKCICITPEGVQLIEQHLDEIKNI